MLSPTALIDSAHVARRRLARGASRNPWVLAIWSVTLAFMAVAIATSVHIGVPIRDPEGTILGKRIVVPFAFMALFILLDSMRRARPLWRTGDVRRTAAIRTALSTRWGWQRATLALVGFFAFHVTYLGYRNLKSFVPLVQYETYDPQLLRLDSWMLFGNSPAELTHDLLGTKIAAYILSAVYLAFIPLVPISVAAALTFATRMREGYVFVAASIYCWILGTASYFLIPSIGPFGSGAAWQFDDLAVTGVTRLQEVLVDHRFWIYSDPIGYAGVNSIGGFASLHVGIVFMAYLMARYYGSRLFSIAAMTFLVPTVISTIYFGWHYIADDIAGLGIGWLAVVFGKWTIFPEHSPFARVLLRRRRRHGPATAGGRAS